MIPGLQENSPQHTARNKSQRALWETTGILLFIIVLFFSFWTGYRGIDFGHHWDEPKLIISVAHVVESGTFLPRWYNYPSLSFILAATPMVVDVFERIYAKGTILLDNPQERSMMLTEVRNYTLSKAYLLRVRLLFLVFSTFGGVWLFILIWLLTRTTYFSAVGSTLYLCSWEVQYHSRWIAPDCIMMQFVILTLLFILWSKESRHPSRMLLFASIASGLAVNTKYTGIISILPLCIGWYGYFRSAHSRNENRLRAALSSMIIPISLLFFISVIVTPALLVDPIRFVRDIIFEYRHYSSFGHGGHTPNGFFDHLCLELKYIFLTIPSHYVVVSVIVSLISAYGFVALYRYRKESLFILISIPILFVLYLATKKVFLARNVLLVSPFLALYFSIGLYALTSALRSRLSRYFILCGTLFIIGLNAAWLFKTSECIGKRSLFEQLFDLSSIGNADTTANYILSDQLKRVQWVRRVMHQQSVLPSNTKFSDDAEVVFLYDHDRLLKHLWKFPVGRFPYRLLPHGPFEVNWDMYPNWSGEPRIIIIPYVEMKKYKLVFILHE